MLKYIGQIIRSFSVQKKILSAFFAICAICFVTVFGIAIPQLAKSAEDHIIYSGDQAMIQAREYISYRMDNLRELSYSMAYDHSVNSIISHKEEDYSVTQQLADRRVLAQVITKNLATDYKSISNICYYLNDSFSYVSSISPNYKPLSDFSGSEWFSIMLRNKLPYYYIPPQLNTDDQMLSVVHMISSPYDFSEIIGAVVISSPLSSLSSILSNCAVTENSYAYLINDEGYLICSSNNGSDFSGSVLMSYDEFVDNTYSDKDNLYYACRLDLCGWTLIQVIPKHDFLAVRFEAMEPTLLVCVIMLLVLFFLSYKLASSITKRINILSETMQDFRLQESAPLDVLPDGDEIDYLMESYNELIDRIERLEILNIKKEQRLNKTELALLHSQINPHFLYNTLDMIRSLADHNEMDKVSVATRALSVFYHSGVGNRTHWSILQKELDQIQAYIKIQQLRYGEQIQLEIFAEPEYLDVNLPRITLQPLVENSLIHGILSYSRAGVITIRVSPVGQNELNISIKDNGCGMDAGTLSELLLPNHPDGGIGIWNTNERIRLHYGKGFGISATSRLHEYTEIVIRIPIYRGKECETNEAFDS